MSANDDPAAAGRNIVRPDFWRLGLLGGPGVAASPSPDMHRAALSRAGLKGSYEAMNVPAEELGDTVARLAAEGWHGLNVTAPHKVAVMKFLSGVSPEAEAVGSVNTLALAGDGSYFGHNTDARGFAGAYQGEASLLAGTGALVLGAGGAARAAAAALMSLGMSVKISARKKESAVLLADSFELGTAGWEELNELEPFDLVVNATSGSSLSDFAAVPRPRLAGRALVVDLNYARENNYFLSLAGENGAIFRDGLAMLAFQACLSFALWTGFEAGLTVFFNALRRRYRRPGPAQAAAPDR
ncbi:MAG: shikimate dehydrogenase [Deltaproteobacteria bacterium]|jgi:shikimate dehydrogenase|nr:shikimate dehydrogenase [Deltaproteobacteria bacterium]